MPTSSTQHPDHHQDVNPASLLPVAISRSSGMTLWPDHTVSHVSDWIDSNGEFSDPDDAVTCVVQHPTSGKWFAIDLADYPSQTLH